MAPSPAKPDRYTGLPPGVRVGPLGRRLLAHLIDGIVPAVLTGLVLQRRDGVQTIDVVAYVLLAVWGLVVWGMFATRAAGPGMRLMKLQLVGFSDGRPIGWGRFFVRALVLGLLSATGIGLLLMLVFLLAHPRYQGWHDRSVNAVVIVQRMLPPRTRRPATATAPELDAQPGDGQAESRPVQKAAAGSPDARQAESRPLTPSAGSPGVDPLAGAVPASALPMAPSGVEVGMSPLAPGVVAAGPVPAGDAPSQPTVADRPAAAVQRAAPAPLARWTAVLDDGRELPVTGLVLLGRNPQPRPGEEGAALVKLADETRTVSKSHLALDVDGDGLVVVDRGSTNGSTVTTTAGVTTPCESGQPVHAPEGAIVSMGDHWFAVRRN